MKEVAAAIMNGLTRRLEEAVDEGMPSEATQKVFDPVVFWCVNAIWMTVLAGVVIWIWKCGGAECLTSSVRNSDIDYRRRLAQRERDRIEKRRVSPEKRRTLLMEYFRARKVHMVVGEFDIIKETPDEAKHDEDENKDEAPTAGTSGFDTDTCIETGSVDAADAGVPLQTETETEASNVDVSVDTCIVDLESSNHSNKEVKDEPICLDIETGVGLDDSVRSGSVFKSIMGGLDASIRSVMGRDLDESIRSIDQGFLVLPNKTQVPNCCAVCLGTYEEGEDVVWSENCQHAFHEECVTEWLIKMQEGNPCPCCRSVFVDVDAVKPDKPKSVERRPPPQNVMNLGVIRL